MLGQLIMANKQDFGRDAIIYSLVLPLISLQLLDCIQSGKDPKQHRHSELAPVVSLP